MGSDDDRQLKNRAYVLLRAHAEIRIEKNPPEQRIFIRDLRARADYQNPDVRPIIDRACQLMRPEMMVCAGCGSDDTRRRSTYVAECNVCEGLTSIDCEEEVVFRSAKTVRAAQAEFEAQDRDIFSE